MCQSNIADRIRIRPKNVIRRKKEKKEIDTGIFWKIYIFYNMYNPKMLNKKQKKCEYNKTIWIVAQQIQNKKF